MTLYTLGFIKTNRFEKWHRTPLGFMMPKAFNHNFLPIWKVFPDRIWNGTKSSNQKYGVICYKHPVHNRWCTMHVHRFSVMLHNRNLAIPQHLDASRLCHNTLCLVPEHISFESHEFNNQRQACVTEGRCLGHPHPLPNCLLNLKM